MSGEYHEPRDLLSPKTLDVKRAIDSMREELEAVDWYRQRLEVATDPELKAILDHHQAEEVEHFAMLLEWLRRNDETFGEQLKTYLFSTAPIVEVEDEMERGGEARGADEARPELDSRRRTVGSLKVIP